MNKAIIILVLLFIVFKGFSQNVDIPDSNFKRALLSYQPIIDINGDKEIQKEEAEKITDLSIYGREIVSLNGLESFVNLKTLDCSENKITELKISSLPKLSYLRCSRNELTLLEIKNTARLSHIDCSENKLKLLIVPNSVIRLYCQDNVLEKLPLSDYSNIETLVCSHNKLTSIPVERLVFLSSLDCSNNSIGSFYFMGGALKDLNCGFNQLTALDINHLSYLKTLACAGNKIDTLVVGNLKNLEMITCNSTGLKKLNLFNLPKLKYVEASGNKDLAVFNLKDELSNTISMNLHGNDKLSFICTDEDDKISFANKFNVSINTGCNSGLPGKAKEVLVKDLSGTDKCAVEVFLKQIISAKRLSGSVTKLESVDFKKSKTYYSLGVDLAKGLPPEIQTKQNGYIRIKLKKIKNIQSSNCNPEDWKTLNWEHVSNKNETKSIDIFDLAESNFEEAEYFDRTKELALVKMSGKWGMINSTGEKIIDTQYDTIMLTSSDFHVKQNGKWGIMNEKGQMLAPPKYDKIQENGFPRVKDTRFLAVGIGGKYGFLNREYKEVVPLIYDEVNILSFKYPLGERKGKTVLIDEITGKEKTPLKYDFIEYFFDWLKVGIKETRTVGLINEDGKEVVKPIYEKLFMGNSNALVYKRADKYGLMDHKGNEITKPVFDYIDGFFTNGKSKAKFNGQDVLINDKGEIDK